MSHQVTLLANQNASQRAAKGLKPKRRPLRPIPTRFKNRVEVGRCVDSLWAWLCSSVRHA